MINPTGKFLGVPYDWRKPTKERFRSRLWNPNASIWNPHAYGWGYSINLYAVIHPIKYRRTKQIK